MLYCCTAIWKCEVLTTLLTNICHIWSKSWSTKLSHTWEKGPVSPQNVFRASSICCYGDNKTESLYNCGKGVELHTSVAFFKSLLSANCTRASHKSHWIDCVLSTYKDRGKKGVVKSTHASVMIKIVQMMCTWLTFQFIQPCTGLIDRKKMTS